MDRTDTEEYFFGSVLLLANKFQIWGDTLLEGMTLKQWFLLLLISRMDAQNPTVKAVADFAGTSRQNVKKMLEHLEREGYVSLNRSRGDARALSVRLTDRTFAFFNAYAQKGADAVRELFMGVSDGELKAAVETADKLFLALEKTGGNAGHG